MMNEYQQNSELPQQSIKNSIMLQNKASISIFYIKPTNQTAKLLKQLTRRYNLLNNQLNDDHLYIFKLIIHFKTYMLNKYILLIALIIACNCLSFNKHLQNPWDSYLENGIQQSNGNSKKFAILALDGGASWTSPNHPNSFKITPAEGQKVAAMMKSGDFTSAQANGIVLEGVKYQFLREDGKVAFAKKKGYGGITIQKSKTAVVIGYTEQGKNQSGTNKAVSIIADYLESVGM